MWTIYQLLNLLTASPYAAYTSEITGQNCEYIDKFAQLLLIKGPKRANYSHLSNNRTFKVEDKKPLQAMVDEYLKVYESKVNVLYLATVQEMRENYAE